LSQVPEQSYIHICPQLWCAVPRLPVKVSFPPLA